MASWIGTLTAAAADERPALLDPIAGERLSFGELRAASAKRAAELAGPRGLAFHFVENTVAGVVDLFGLLEAGHAVALLDPETAPDARAALLRAYRPDRLSGAWNDADERVRSDGRETAAALHPELSVLLSTSGSTGSPKFVRLSGANLAANARAIATVLEIAPDDVACGHLGLHYSYGLSVLTSHLHAGSAVALVRDGFTTSAFWRAFKDAGCTHLPGVPYHYEMLSRLSLKRLGLSSLRACTQAGGRLRPQLIDALSTELRSEGRRFYVMYGQTEASPRMSTLPSDALPAKLGSVGPALPGGRFEIVGPEGRPVPDGADGEVVYSGPNVAMGYALSRSDLHQGDIFAGRLHTGDLGRLDEDGCLFVTGRAARFAKVVGVRVSLDEVEALVGSLEVAAVDMDGKLGLFVAGAESEALRALEGDVAKALKLHHSVIEARPIDALPRRPNGKIDYAALKAAV